MVDPSLISASVISISQHLWRAVCSRCTERLGRPLGWVAGCAADGDGLVADNELIGSNESVSGIAVTGSGGIVGGEAIVGGRGLGSVDERLISSLSCSGP